MHLLGTCLLISSLERSQMSVPSGPSKTARKHLCPFFTCLFLVMMLDSCIYCCCVFAHVMQVRWKSGTLCPIHPEGLPWNPRLSCYAAALRSVLFSWQVFHFYSCYSVELFFHNFGADAMCVTDWWSYLFLVEVDFSPINNNKTSHFLNSIVIGSMSTLALALIPVLGFLWICLLSRKKSIGGNYVKMDKLTVIARSSFCTNGILVVFVVDWGQGMGTHGKTKV